MMQIGGIGGSGAVYDPTAYTKHDEASGCSPPLPPTLLQYNILKMQEQTHFLPLRIWSNSLTFTVTK